MSMGQNYHVHVCSPSEESGRHDEPSTSYHGRQRIHQTRLGLAAKHDGRGMKGRRYESSSSSCEHGASSCTSFSSPTQVDCGLPDPVSAVGQVKASGEVY